MKLKQHRLNEKEKILKNGLKFKEDYLVFTNVRKFHALRHTFATQLFKKSTPIITVSKLLGHTNLDTTEIYTHILREQKDDTVNLLNKLFI